VSFHTGDEVDVTTADVAHGGWCVARPAGGPVMFVRHALPGERVRARVTEVTARFARADAVAVLDPSPDRVEPPCPSAGPGRCGGCDWQHASLPAQRAIKAAVIAGQLRRLAGLDREVTVEPLPGDGEDAGASSESDNSNMRGRGLGWRTRVQFAVREDGLAGLRAHRSHRVIDVGDCLLAHPAIRDLGIPRLRWEGASGVEAVTSGQECAVIVTAGGAGRGRGEGHPGGRAGTRERGGAAGGRSAAEEPAGMTAVTAGTVLSRAGRRVTPVRGGPFLSYLAAGREWRVSAGAFWQVHPAAAGALAAAVIAALEPGPGDTALDLYCGAGLFAGTIAPLVSPGGTVVGVEADESAVRDARYNLRQWPGARVHRGDVARVLRRGGLPLARIAVADPPRDGLAREVIGYLTAAGTERLAYVSCDPATLARDIGLLRQRGWALDGLRAFDAFPMTHHVECVAALSRGGRGHGASGSSGVRSGLSGLAVPDT
jgi:tRNA/tmRNA/rRNA uracil-C5-methylase (TrmA/RlmC/RlmD family)